MNIFIDDSELNSIVEKFMSGTDRNLDEEILQIVMESGATALLHLGLEQPPEGGSELIAFSLEITRVYCLQILALRELLKAREELA